MKSTSMQSEAFRFPGWDACSFLALPPGGSLALPLTPKCFAVDARSLAYETWALVSAFTGCMI